MNDKQPVEIDTLWGHPIELVAGEWVYVDDQTPTACNPRPCKKCGSTGHQDKRGFDACLGELPGVANACCGHGDPAASYVQFDNGVTVRGFDRIESDT